MDQEQIRTLAKEAGFHVAEDGGYTQEEETMSDHNKQHDFDIEGLRGRFFAEHQRVPLADDNLWLDMLWRAARRAPVPAASELSRLQAGTIAALKARVSELEAELAAIGAGGVEPLRKKAGT